MAFALEEHIPDAQTSSLLVQSVFFRFHLQMIVFIYVGLCA
jgi:hypothetical protein